MMRAGVPAAEAIALGETTQFSGDFHQAATLFGLLLRPQIPNPTNRCDHR
jgi:hypothetical protein